MSVPFIINNIINNSCNLGPLVVYVFLDPFLLDQPSGIELSSVCAAAVGG